MVMIYRFQQQLNQADLENFLENHIKSLKGAALLRSSCNNIAISSLPESCEAIDDSHSFTSSTIISNNFNENDNYVYIENRTKSPPYDAEYNRCSLLKYHLLILRLRKVEQLKAGTEKAKSKQKITLILIQTRTYGI
ncbi:unnamed protein product [Macrosiphum euphorbiae]|uniref:Uncharacterized protein n=1 Tax=Macrosiphum euphorbiae TaxID=13131 RepID=A0AAV0X482_9HEMI|nr:unnamed protein product [Macrosiphum euphorbiae]